MLRAPSRPPPDLPPVESWAQFSSGFFARWRQGQHVLGVGPTGSGKTVLARTLANTRRYVCVLGTKIHDEEMTAYIDQGYVRLDDWPGDAQLRRIANKHGGMLPLVLWPKIKSRDDLFRFRSVYAKALDSMLVQGGWTIVADEGLWLSKRNSRSQPGLDLGNHLESIAYTGRSSNVTLIMLVQRPASVPVNTWTNSTHAFIWKLGNTRDMRELASLGTVDPKAVQTALPTLDKHQFLYLPCRAGVPWAISEVQL
jgi:hypothetical protein